MSELIDRQAFIENERRLYCEDCDRRKGKKNGKLTVCYEIGEAPCRACWLDDALGDLDDFPTASPWHRVEEPPKEGTWCVIAKHSYLQPHNLFYDIAHYLHGTFSVYDSGVGDWFDGKPLYWMPIEPPKEDE